MAMSTQGKSMKRLMSSVLLVSMMSASVHSFATDVVEDDTFDNSRPSVYAMGLDAGLVRPVGVVATVGGIGLFIATLPFSLLGGNVKESAQKLVVDPARMTFYRCLGCTTGQDNANTVAHDMHDDDNQ